MGLAIESLRNLGVLAEWMEIATNARAEAVARRKGKSAEELPTDEDEYCKPVTELTGLSYILGTVE